MFLVSMGLFINFLFYKISGYILFEKNLIQNKYSKQGFNSSIDPTCKEKLNCANPNHGSCLGKISHYPT